MKFYNRKNELALLRQIEKQSKQSAEMTFVVGRRRIGKTSLLTKAYSSSNCLYFFVAKKNEALLCQEFLEEIKQKLKVPIFGNIKTFREIFQFLMELSKNKNFSLVIDEFQEFYTVNQSVFSDMQNIWDANKQTSKINLIMCGSVYARVSRIFENSKEPLFGRATNRIHLKAFDIQSLKTVLNDYHPNYSSEDLLAFYLFTSGVPKYIELLVKKNATTLSSILDEIFSENSILLDEGKNVLIEEFGKEYANYFSILSLIASGKTSRVEIESILEMQTGGFLDRLENDYGLIKKVRPIFSKPNSRRVKYSIEDNFLSFWFRFIYKYRSAIEHGNLDYVKTIVLRDYKTYSGKILEKYFVQKLKAKKKFNLIGTYWDKSNHYEIDIVAVNDLEKKLLFAEVKRQKSNIKINTLKEKSQKLLPKFKDYDVVYKGFSLEDMG